MASRHANALAISDGACNPSGIAHAIVDAVRECRDERGDTANDGAIKLMVHQLAHVVRLPTDASILDWATWRTECEARK